jgi:hypothetical protein
MGTSTSGEPGRGPRVRGSARGAGGAAERDEQYDLLTAALLGAAIGAGATLLLRAAAPRKRRFVLPAARALTNPRVARRIVSAGEQGVRWAREHGEALVDPRTHRAVEKHLRGYLRTARRAIDQTVQSELRDLRRALRRQRKRLGV